MTLRQLSLNTVLQLQPANFQIVIQKHQRLSLKANKATLNSAFTKACIDQRVIPNFLRCRLPTHLKSSHHLLRRGQRKTLTRAHAENIKKEEENKKNLKYFEDEHHDEVELLRAVSQARNYKQIRTIQTRQTRKLNNLSPNNNEQASKPKPTNVIYNLSSRKLTNVEEEALQYGMGMCWPQTPRELDMKAETEILYQQIKKTENLPDSETEDLKHQLRSAVKTILKKRKQVPRRITEMMKALRKLCADQSLYIARPDKGNGVVIMDRTTYVAKMMTILNDPSKFKKVTNKQNKHLFTMKEDQINRRLLKMKNDGMISEDIYKQVRSTGSQPPRLYGLPKLHKDEKNPPLRPILSMINSYCDNISQWLLSLLSPFLPSSFNVKDSFTASEKIRGVDLCDVSNVYITSFDAIKLFTNIPLNDTINHIIDIIPTEKIPISTNTLKNLLNIACKEVPFIFNSTHYIQIDGLSMGSCLAPMMAEFALHMIEQNITVPKLYLRYVDDTLAIFDNENQATNFLHKINSFHPSLQFTMEKPTNNSINFLDMTVYIENNTLHTKWYLKPTNNHIYTHRHAYSPNTYKNNAIKALYIRSQKLTTDVHHKQETKQKVIDIFSHNGYHINHIERIMNKCDSPKDDQQKTKKSLFWRIPYTRDADSEIRAKVHKINKMLQKSTIKIAYKTYKTQNMCKNKDKISNDESSSIVYKFQCELCPASYIGETRRHLHKRITEHIKGRPISEISLHMHPPSANNFTILTKTNHTKISEALFIKKHIQEGFQLINNQKTSEILNLF